MSEKSHPKNSKNTEDSKQDNKITPEDTDFWDLEVDAQPSETTLEEIEEIDRILAEQELYKPLIQLSKREIDIEVPCEKEILSSLDSHKGSEALEALQYISNKDVDELLASATAEVMAEEDGIELTPEPEIAPAPAINKADRSATEKIASIFCYLAILGVFGYLVHYASEQHDFDTSKSYAANTPVKGENADIENIETWWSEPVSNNTKFGVVLVPSATITLGPDSDSGVIRSVFYSYEEGLQGQLRPKGDPFTHEFRDGKFSATRTNQITIYGTDGFTDMSHYIFYRGQDEKRWLVDVKEAPSSQTQVNNFSFLAQAPVEPIRK